MMIMMVFSVFLYVDSSVDSIHGFGVVSTFFGNVLVFLVMFLHFQWFFHMFFLGVLGFKQFAIRFVGTISGLPKGMAFSSLKSNINHAYVLLDFLVSSHVDLEVPWTFRTFRWFFVLRLKGSGSNVPLVTSGSFEALQQGK